jgi:biopolymer transport protein ExbD
MKADINVTPLIDVLLVLLIIFILVSPVAPRSLGTSLLHPPNGGRALGPATLLLEVRAEEYALNTSPVAVDQLAVCQGRAPDRRELEHA